MGHNVTQHGSQRDPTWVTFFSLFFFFLRFKFKIKDKF
jgi:hypothetical protein